MPRIFDRGHLVRRLDPVWGSAAVALRAADDTFHFTNCAPQASKFNQGKRLWRGLENYVLNNAIATDERITVLSGPVFGDNDRTYRDLPIPGQFWKILVRVGDDALRATAFLADQSDFLDVLDAGLEEIPGQAPPAHVSEKQVAIRDIADRTGLDFGALGPHDTYDGLERVVARPAEVVW